MVPSFCLLLFALFFSALILATDDGLTTKVTWDPHSLMVNGERVFIFSGEFHYERLPVPELWLDIFQKFKANGLNAVSIYFFWSYHSASRDVYDVETSGKNVQRVFDMAKEAGLYVIARPGPYCNAETNAGGFALWTSDGSGGQYRTSDETYHQAWLPWIQEIGKIIARNQITEGGPVILYQIENELQETVHQASNTLVLYMEQLEEATRDAGIVVPLTHNEKGQRSESWSTDYQDVGGAVNIYGLDSYPGGLSCTNINTGFSLVRNYYQWFQNYSYTQPEFWPEFESGWFSPWGSETFYDECLAEHDTAFADVYYKNNIGQRGTMMNLYMAYGGTNWGNLAAPVVYTSYDYAAPLRETREVQLKFSQTKLIALFTRVSQDLLYADMESNGTGNAVSTSDIWTWVLRNSNTSAGFYVTQHATSSSRAVTNFSVYLNTSVGSITVPNVQLNGRQSKILVTDYYLANQTLLYSSADVLTYGIFGSKTVLVLYLQEGQIGEFGFTGNVTVQSSDNANITTSLAQANGTSAYSKFVWNQSVGKSIVQLSNGVLVYLLDIPSAWTFFAPPTTSNPNIKPSEHIFVLGPYLVRNVTISSSTVILSGDNANSTTIEIYADASINSISWNNHLLPTTSTPHGSLTATIPGVENRTITIPTLSWVSADSLPEAAKDYNDTSWTLCNKTSTLAPVTPLTLPVLYSSDYGYFVGARIYRGYFPGKTAVSVNVTAQNGLASGWSAWLNGVFVGGNPGNASSSATTAVLDFDNVTLEEGDGENVLTVLVDYTGHDETSTGKGAENPRGLLGATLLGSNGTTLPFSRWKIQGNAGGDGNIDPVRGPLNEGGLYGERLGWHLPGFVVPETPSAWIAETPMQGFDTAGVRWYVATFELDFDGDLDVPVGVELGAEVGTVASVQIYWNGYQYGKFIPQIGPQTRFSIPPGIVNNKGNNTLSLSVWAQTAAGAKLSKVEVFAYGVYQTSFGFGGDFGYLQPGWTEERLGYA